MLHYFQTSETSNYKFAGSGEDIGKERAQGRIQITLRSSPTKGPVEILDGARHVDGVKPGSVFARKTGGEQR